MLANPRTSSTNSGRLEPRRIGGRFDEFANQVCLSDSKFGQGPAGPGPAAKRLNAVPSESCPAGPGAGWGPGHLAYCPLSSYCESC